LNGCENPRIVIGANSAGWAPSVVLMNPRSATPTTVIDWPFTVIDWPTIDGSSPKRRCQ
jgi:hypothetical protein